MGVLYQFPNMRSREKPWLNWTSTVNRVKHEIHDKADDNIAGDDDVDIIIIIIFRETAGVSTFADIDDESILDAWQSCTDYYFWLKRWQCDIISVSTFFLSSILKDQKKAKNLFRKWRPLKIQYCFFFYWESLRVSSTAIVFVSQ